MDNCTTFYNCLCTYSDNIFIDEYRLKVRYTDDKQFIRDFQKELYERGCLTSEAFIQVLEQVKKEVERRSKLAEESMWRKSEIALRYTPLHPEIYVFQESFLAAEFLKAVSYCRSSEASLDGVFNFLNCIPEKRIYKLPVFVPSFCKDFVEELENFERSELPKGRPNKMNNYGILLDELGFDDSFITPFCQKYLKPVTSILYPRLGGKRFDSHKSFAVQYAMNKDIQIGSHCDNSEITLNVSLGKEFTGGNLYFSTLSRVPVNERSYVEVKHILGQGILHRGGHIHEAFPITSGERWNLIIWLRNSSVRNHICPMCTKTPHLIETIGQGDGFTLKEGKRSLDHEDTCTIC